jgi:hypothetical protein
MKVILVIGLLIGIGALIGAVVIPGYVYVVYATRRVMERPWTRHRLAAGSRVLYAARAEPRHDPASDVAALREGVTIDVQASLWDPQRREWRRGNLWLSRQAPDFQWFPLEVGHRWLFARAMTTFALPVGKPGRPPMTRNDPPEERLVVIHDGAHQFWLRVPEIDVPLVLRAAGDDEQIGPQGAKR